MSSAGVLRKHLPSSSGIDADALLEGFLAYVEELGLALYPAQEEAILELFSGAHVVLNTPTGSGKSLVAEAMHFRALARNEVSFYTAPIKALVSEKFFSLCRAFGPEEVGMLTGDASVNPDAPVICCTAEILSNLALRQGDQADVQHVIMDEFHYYSDRDRGPAWQIPLLTLPQCRFLLMSATLGDASFFQHELERRTGAPARLVESAERPVPLDFAYRETPLHETVAELLERNEVPVYIVHFSQREASARAQDLMSVDFLTKAQKQEIKQELHGFRFDTPFGKELRRFVHHGVGVHHAGLLPKYRLMVEKLAQAGHLKLICGTDTLGVGVNIPIRTVLFTKLCKYDGEKTRVLSVRDFKQIAGRAGRKGFDERGAVVAQAPEHVIENRSMELKAVGDAKKLRKLVRKKPPDRGYAHWDESTFSRLIESDPEPLTSSFDVSHAMLLHVFERPGNGCRAMGDLLDATHETPRVRRRLKRTAIRLFRSLQEAGIVDLLTDPDENGRYVRLNEHLQTNFSLNQSLALWVVDMLPALDVDALTYAADVVTLVEAVQENPTAVLIKQVDKLKTELLQELKAKGVEYEERMAELERVERLKPLADQIYPHFNDFAERHPWVGENIRPKSVARDMWERGHGFVDYVKELGLQRSEGVLLRYLSDVYKAMVQSVPERFRNAEVQDVLEWLGAVVRQVDSSLIDEWERLRHAGAEGAEPGGGAGEDLAVRPGEPDIFADRRAFTVLLRNTLFRVIGHLARRRYEAAAAEFGNEDLPAPPSIWTPERIAATLEPYWQQYSEIRVDPAARGAAFFAVQEGSETWAARQTLLDPEAHGEWHLDVRIDVAASREAHRPVLQLRYLGPQTQPWTDQQDEYP